MSLARYLQAFAKKYKQEHLDSSIVMCEESFFPPVLVWGGVVTANPQKCHGAYVHYVISVCSNLSRVLETDPRISHQGLTASAEGMLDASLNQVTKLFGEKRAQTIIHELKLSIHATVVYVEKEFAHDLQARNFFMAVEERLNLRLRT
jgi:hypothetical protein